MEFSILLSMASRVCKARLGTRSPASRLEWSENSGAEMMANSRFKSMPVEELTAKFEQFCLEQYECLIDGKIGRHNRLVDKIRGVREELRARGERQALLPLLNHKNRQVRYQAAMATLLVAPARARSTRKAEQEPRISPGCRRQHCAGQACGRKLRAVVGLFLTPPAPW